MTTGESILANTFIEKLRCDLVVDSIQYQSLCSDLRKLAAEWRNQTHVEKRVVQDLYVLAPIATAMGHTIAKNRPQLGDAVLEMAVEIDALVLDCLATWD